MALLDPEWTKLSLCKASAAMRRSWSARVGLHTIKRMLQCEGVNVGVQCEVSADAEWHACLSLITSPAKEPGWFPVRYQTSAAGAMGVGS
jgi:hypothetical protein